MCLGISIPAAGTLFQDTILGKTTMKTTRMKKRIIRLVLGLGLTALNGLACLSAESARAQQQEAYIVAADTYYPPVGISGFDEIWGRVSVAVNGFGPEGLVLVCWRPTGETSYTPLAAASFGYRIEDSDIYKDFLVYQFLIAPESSSQSNMSGIEFYLSVGGFSFTCDNTVDPTDTLLDGDAWLAADLDVTVFSNPETRVLMLPDDVAELFSTIVSKTELQTDANGNAFCLFYRNTSSPRMSYTWQEGSQSSLECFALTAQTASGYYVYKWETNNPVLVDKPGLDEGAGYAYFFKLSDGSTRDNGGYYYTGIEAGSTPTVRH